MLTVKQITALAPGQAASDGGSRGSGALCFKASKTGTVSCVFRYAVNRRVVDMPLGRFDEAGRAGLSLAEARAKAGELQRMIQAGIPDPKAWLAEQERLKAEAAAKAKAEAEAAEAAARAAATYCQTYTLRALCAAYVAHLTAQGKYSDRAARSLFKRWVNAYPEIADLPARDVTPDHIAALVRRPHEAGRARVPDVLRSYLSAAFNAARRAKYDPKLPASLAGYEVNANPCDLIPTQPAKAGTRVLTMAELRAFLLALREDVQSDRVLLVALLAGGQRLMQLARVPVAAFDPEAGTITLEDRKGGRVNPRQHNLPLAPEALRLVAENAARARAAGGSYLFAATPDAAAPLQIIGIGDRMRRVVAELDGEPFTWRDVRRSCETGLAGLGVSKDTRSQLLSHNLGTVTDKHYDRFDYHGPKHAALLAWENALTGATTTPGNVVSIATRRRVA